MSLHDLIYSQRRPHRLARHLTLWVLYGLCFTIQSYVPADDYPVFSWHLVKLALLSTALFFPFCCLAVYVLLYWLYPRFLQTGRFVRFYLAFFGFALAGLGMNYEAGVLFFRYSGRPSIAIGEFNLGMHNVAIGIIVSVFILGCKLGRNAYIQQKANLRLAAQKTRAELQLLKTRIDPRFLFNSLDDLKSKVDSRQPDAPAAILRLADTLSDILYGAEGEEAPAGGDESFLSREKGGEPGYRIPVSGTNRFAYNLLFSKARWVRLSRHGLFWLARMGYLAYIFHLRIYLPDGVLGLTWATAWGMAFLEMAAEAAIAYSIVYWLTPTFLQRKKYGAFALAVFLLLSTVFAITYPIQEICLFIQHNPSNYAIFWDNAMQFFRLSFASWLLFIAIRLFKAHYERMQQRETLGRETADVEFQVLKAQVHPHFLFNTLNNIYSFALAGSPRAGELLAQLSDMMRYMIHDCEADRMPLDRELRLLRDYIGLENARYGDRLDMQVEIDGDTAHRAVAPLLMIPFIENCYKHGASQMLGQPWVKLRISTGGNRLDFQLSNSRPPAGTGTNGKGGGIGLKNIRKRLELLYHGQYRLEIESGTDKFSVHMLVPLEEEIRHL